jgi:hypothetical protein
MHVWSLGLRSFERANNQWTWVRVLPRSIWNAHNVNSWGDHSKYRTYILFQTGYLHHDIEREYSDHCLIRVPEVCWKSLIQVEMWHADVRHRLPRPAGAEDRRDGAWSGARPWMSQRNGGSTLLTGLSMAPLSHPRRLMPETEIHVMRFVVCERSCRNVHVMSRQPSFSTWGVSQFSVEWSMSLHSYETTHVDPVLYAYVFIWTLKRNWNVLFSAIRRGLAHQKVDPVIAHDSIVTDRKCGALHRPALTIKDANISKIWMMKNQSLQEVDDGGCFEFVPQRSSEK